MTNHTETVGAQRIRIVPSFHYDVAYLRTYEEYLPQCFRILDEAQIPREYLLVNEAAIRALGKSTKGKAKVNGIEFFEKAQVSASRGGR